MDNNKDLIVLSEDDKIKIEKAIRNIGVPLHMIFKENLTKKESETYLQSIKYSFKEIADVFNFNEYFEKQEQEYILKIRTLNKEVRRIQKLLGEKATSESMQLFLQKIKNDIYDYFRDLEIFYVSKSDIILNEYSISISVSSSLTHKTKLEKLCKEHGITYRLSKDNSDTIIYSTDSNKKIIKDLITKKFNTAKFTKFITEFDFDYQNQNETEIEEIKGFEFYIKYSEL
jgi:hypothetical protein